MHRNRETANWSGFLNTLGFENRAPELECDHGETCPSDKSGHANHGGLGCDAESYKEQEGGDSENGRDGGNCGVFHDSGWLLVNLFCVVASD